MIQVGSPGIVKNIFDVTEVQASGETPGQDLLPFADSIIVILDSSGGRGGSDNKLSIKLQHSEDNVTFEDVPGGAFQDITTTPLMQHINFEKATLKRYLRISGVLSGTNPSFFTSGKIVGLGRI